MAIHNRDAPLLLVKLRVPDGQEYRVVTDSVVSFEYIDSERKADQVKLRVDNRDLSNFDDPVWRKGGELIVQWGYVGRMTLAREAVITGVKGFSELEITANAKSVLMNRVRKTRTFEGKSVASIVRDIARENGYDVTAQIVDDTSDAPAIISQANETDAMFIRRWANRIGFEFYVDHEGFHFHPRRLGSPPVGVWTYHSDPGQGDIIGEPTIENDITAKPGRVRVQGRDPVELQDFDVKADNRSDSDRDALGVFEDIVDLETGTSITVERQVATEETIASPDENPAEATRRARGRFRRSQQVAVKMRVNVVGDPNLYAKTVREIRGMGRRLSQLYWVREVKHTLGSNGYECEAHLISDGHGGHATVSRRAVGLQLIEVGRAGRGPGAGTGRSGEIESQLEAAAVAAESAGDDTAARSLRGALAGYRASGGRNTADVQSALGAVARGAETAEARQAAAGVLSSVVQQGSEVENAGRVNQAEAADPDDDRLRATEQIDLETGTTITTYGGPTGRQTG